LTTINAFYIEPHDRPIINAPFIFLIGIMRYSCNGRKPETNHNSLPPCPFYSALLGRAILALLCRTTRMNLHVI